MNNEEAAAACRVAGFVAVEVATTVEGVHMGILSRIRSATGSPTVDVVERHTGAVYRIVKAVGGAAGEAGAAVASATVREDGPRMADSAKGAAWLAGLHAAIGDRIDDDPRTAVLTTAVSFRRDGMLVAPADVASDAAAAGINGLAVFVHGLGGTEHQWSPRYASALAEHGFASAYIRYNGGRPIHANGADLAALLSELGEALQQVGWTAPLMLIGHSMGGLVIRSGVAQSAGAAWVGRVRDVVTLGSPHRGAPMEKVAALALTGLRQFRESAPIASFGNQRARGIKDLRFGALLAEHWDGRDPDDVLRDTTAPTPLPEWIRQHTVAATVGAPGGLLGEVFGDGLVRRASAFDSGPGRGHSNAHHLTETGHMKLLDDPRVVEILANAAADRH